jgi:uncharacterized protein YyaL (SSP411 family)
MEASRNGRKEIRWREWSTDAFDEAAKSEKLVLLDLFAPWCHWCHVMDRTTYSDSDVIRMINEKFVPVRVDIDGRPDISERYNRGGFPTTAFLSDRGESIWGATYVPPDDMKRIMKSVLASKASGEVDKVLERERMQFLDVSKALERKESADSTFVDSIFEDIFSTYDVQWGGFGGSQKFPHPDVIDLLLHKYLENQDAELSDAVVSTLDHMTDGLYDKVEGGVFRYSVTRDWKEPHYEKMLETNLGFLHNLVRAHQVLGQERFAKTARGVAKYLLGVLRDSKTGGFFSSQDADEDYYRSPSSERAHGTPPRVVRDIYSGWNCEAVSTFIEAGILLGEESWVDAGKAAWKYSVDHHWNPDLAMVRHRKGEELYLFEDQVFFLEALVSMIELAPPEDVEEMLDMGEAIVGGVSKSFVHPDGGYGDVMIRKDAVGELVEPRRSIVSNSKWARSSALFGVIAFKPERTDATREILLSFHPKQVQANGLFAAPYVLAWWTLEKGPQLVEIHGAMNKDVTSAPLWQEAKGAMSLGTIVMSARQVGPEIPRPSKPFAVICRSTGCSKEIDDPLTLFSKLREPRQVVSKD